MSWRGCRVEKTYSQGLLAWLEQLKAEEGTGRQVVQSSLGVAWSPPMIHSAERTEVVHCLRWAKLLLITACDKDGTCYRVRQASKRRERKQLTWSSGILNAAGTSGDAGTVEAGISFHSFLDCLGCTSANKSSLPGSSTELLP